MTDEAGRHPAKFPTANGLGARNSSETSSIGLHSRNNLHFRPLGCADFGAWWTFL